MTTTIEQREQWARALGWRSQKNAPDKWEPVCWVSPSGDCYEDGLPDFANLKGPYVGPAIKELIDADWCLGHKTQTEYVWDDLSDNSQGAQIRHADLGIATMNALKAREDER